ncbi:hypothetical protein BGZ76_005427 [Entomortierella beljakovae]|nr:hypothetical protein BGZ76_005427 [Entomortierella beljakovae]
MSFTLNTSITSHEPGVVILLGHPDPIIEYQIFGTVHLDVQQPVHFNKLVVMFNGEASYDVIRNSRMKTWKVNIARSEFHALSVPKTYEPGKYDIPFTLRVPGDVVIAQIEGSEGKGFIWTYELITLGDMPNPSSGPTTQQTWKTPIKMKRVYLPSPDSPTTVYKSCREGLLTWFSTVPKFIDIEKDSKVRLSFKFDSPKGLTIESIHIEAVESRVCYFNYANLIQGFRRFWLHPPTSHSRHDPANSTVINLDPSYVDYTSENIFGSALIKNKKEKAEWGRKDAIEIEFDIKSKKLLSSESVAWWKVSHGFRIVVKFTNEMVRPFKVTAPVHIGYSPNELLEVK